MSSLEVRGRAPRALLWVTLGSLLVLYGFPFTYLLLTSLKAPLDTIAVPPSVFPSEWTTTNYGSALAREGVVASFVNSVTTAGISTLLSLVLAVPAAYGITRFRTVTGRVFIMGALVARMVPPVAVGVPLPAMIRALGLFDTPLGLAIAHTTISLPLSIWLMASFFELSLIHI